MKIEEHKTEKKFEPITFTVTLENKEELAIWYARFNKNWPDMLTALPNEQKEEGISYRDVRGASIFTFLANKWNEYYDN